MSTTEPRISDVLDPDSVLKQNSPILQLRAVKVKPSPSPPPSLTALAKASCIDRLNHSSPNFQGGNEPDPGNALLIRTLAEGKLPDSVHEDLSRSLPGLRDLSKPAEPVDITVSDESEEEVAIRSTKMSPLPSPGLARSLVLHGPNKGSSAGPIHFDLKSLATDAMNYAAASPQSPPEHSAPSTAMPHIPPIRAPQSPATLPITIVNTNNDEMHRRDSCRSVSSASLSPYPLPSIKNISSSPTCAPIQPSLHLAEGKRPSESSAAGLGGLPPIQMASPPSDTTSQEILPSFRSQFRDQLISGPLGPEQRQGHPQSPPVSGLPPRLGSLSGSHASPPVSPNEFYRTTIPSPASSAPGMSPFGFSPPLGGSHQSAMAGYLAGGGAEPRHMERSQPTNSVVDKMSIDSVTNPPSGFVCSFQGCTAAPFQTQYLLNSHANVHSSARPHYCPVKGCPRAEGGKGFKRKNEMIRHGLVHESPGYVCPFCPDREHKYPRPDNLQRHVRVHHVDKDKDDALLREVLAQRPDGPNRGRRRRGGP